MNPFELVFGIVTVCVVSALIKHYLNVRYDHQARISSAAQGSAKQELESVLHTAEVLEDRINTLEAILDQDCPGWRTRHENYRK